MQSAEHRRRAPAPNRALRALLEETGWTQDTLARAVARTGMEVGLQLRYDRASVAHWLRGSRPDPYVQRLVAEALSRRLGRPVAVAELGMGDGRSGGPGRRPASSTVGNGSARGGTPDTPGGTDARGGTTEESTARCGTVPDRGTSRRSTAARTGTERHSRTVGTERRRQPASPPHSTADGPVTGRTAEPAPAASAAAGDAAAGQESAVTEEAAAGHPADRLAALTAPVVGPPRTAPPTPAPYRLSTPARSAPTAPRPPRSPLPTVPRGGRPLHRTGPDEVASVHEHTRFFARQADRHGGGHIRTSLAGYLSGLVRQLRTGGEGPHHPRLLAGAARLSYLLARVYADEQRHGLAQRAFLTAVELAEEGGDLEGVALAHRALSTQAHQLGHRAQSLALAESACERAPAGTPPSTRAFLYAGLAVAQAADRSHGRAVESLGRAEHELARTPADLTTGPDSPDGESIGAYQDAALLYQSSQVRRELGDPDGAIRELRASLRVRPSGERRARAVSHAELAELLLGYGRLEEACSVWHVFLEDCAMVRSGRARRARDRMPRLLLPYGREPCVQRLLARVGPDTGAPGRHGHSAGR